MSFGATAAPLILEGDYSSYSLLWKQSRDASEHAYSYPVRFDETLDKIFIGNIYQNTFTERKLSDGTNPSVTSTRDYSEYGGKSDPWSILRKYFAYVVFEDGVPKVKVYKDGALIQTIDLSQAPISWTNNTYEYMLNFSTDGKYLFIENYDSAVKEYALFEGS